MCRRLHSLFRRDGPPPRHPDDMPSPDPALPEVLASGMDVSEPRPPAAAPREPVIVRGRAWHNTEEAHRLHPETTEPETVDGLRRRLANVSRTVDRKLAAEALGRMGDQAAEAIPDLVRTAAHKDDGPRQASLAALDAIDPAWRRNPAMDQAMPCWAEALRLGNLRVNGGLEVQLQAIGEPAARGLAQALSDTGDVVGNVFVLRTLGRLGPCAELAAPQISEALRSQHPHVCVAAAKALPQAGHVADALPALNNGLGHWNADVRAAMADCVGTLGSAGEPAAVALLQLLIDGDKAARAAAIGALSNIGPVILPWLIEIVRTRDAQRLMALFKWWHNAPSLFAVPARDQPRWITAEAMNKLSWAAYDMFEDMECLRQAQIAALELMGGFGRAAVRAVPVIQDALLDDNPRVREAAALALEKICREG